MQVSKAANRCLEYPRTHSKKNTMMMKKPFKIESSSNWNIIEKEIGRSGPGQQWHLFLDPVPKIIEYT